MNKVSDAIEDFNWKSSILSVKTTPKTRSFLWKAIVGALPLGTGLSCARLQMLHLVSGVAGRSRRFMCFLNVFLLHKCGSWLCWAGNQILHFTTLWSVCSLVSRAWSLYPPIGGSLTPPYPWILCYLWKAHLLFENRVFLDPQCVEKAIVETRVWQSSRILPPLTRRSSNPSFLVITA